MEFLNFRIRLRLNEKYISLEYVKKSKTDFDFFPDEEKIS